MFLIPNFDVSEKIGKAVRVTKIVKEIKFEGVLGRVRIKKAFPETISYKIFETNSSFHEK